MKDSFIINLNCFYNCRNLQNGEIFSDEVPLTAQEAIVDQYLNAKERRRVSTVDSGLRYMHSTLAHYLQSHQMECQGKVLKTHASEHPSANKINYVV